jgi:DNA-binding response OmpR family regulator
MRGRTVLVIEDERETSETIALYFRHEGCEVHLARDGASGLDAARELDPDLVILDLMLPRLDGLAICRALRAESRTPVIMLTARTTEDDKLRGLDLGADDYVTKPFSPRELVARARAVLRRVDGLNDLIIAGDVTIDLEKHEARIGGEVIALTATELRLLAALARAPGRVFTREELVERAFPDSDALDRTVDAHIKNLRRKIGVARIETVFGAGYKLK